MNGLKKGWFADDDQGEAQRSGQGAAAEPVAMEGFVVRCRKDGVAVPRAHEDKAAEGHEYVFNRESERRAIGSKLSDSVGRGGVP